MRLPSQPTPAMVSHLNACYFNTVWNATKDHGRANIMLTPAAERVQTGLVPVGQSVVGLPTTDAVYAVYKASADLFGRFVRLDDFEWTTDAAITQATGVSFVAYTAQGRVIPNGQIYLRRDPLRQQMLVAINITYTQACLGALYPEVYITVYKDTSRTTPIVTSLYTITTTGLAPVTPAIVTGAIANQAVTYPKGTQVFVNGWFYDPAHVPTLSTGMVVEIVSDPDIVGYCDITVDDSQTGYYSTLYGAYREVLHIPKTINPTNIVITNDTVMAMVVDPVTNKGVYGHRVDPHAIVNITHNDMSMGRTALQAFQTALGSQSVVVRLYVRFPTNPHLLTDDVNHISDLYSQTDAEILLQLTGLSSHQIPEWKASHLEQSPYLSLLQSIGGFPSATVLQQYTQAMGYYDVAATLSQAVRYYTYPGAQVEVLKPARLLGYPCQAMVYANGRKVPHHHVSIINNSATGFLLGFKTSAHVPIGSRIAIYIAEDGGRTPVPFTPQENALTITLPNDDYALFEQIPYDSPQAVWEATTQIGYKTIPVSPADYQLTYNKDGTVTYTLGVQHVGTTFTLVPKYGLVSFSYPIDTYVAAQEAIVFPLKTTDTSGAIVPLIGYATLEVYLNGYRLVEDVDYRCDPVMGQNADVLQTLLTISNADYLNDAGTGNYVEVIAHGDQVVSQDTGFAISNMLHRDTPPMIWSRSCARAFVHGVLVEQVSEVGNVVSSSVNLDDGALYTLQYCLPYSVAKLMAQLDAVSDINVRTRIDLMLGLTRPTYPTTVNITHLYALYSPYLAQIIHDVATGALTIVNDPKDDQFLKQFTAYQLLLHRDPTIRDGNQNIDRRFMTLAASYTNYAVLDPTQMLLVQRLITLLLTPSSLSIQEVLV